MTYDNDNDDTTVTGVVLDAIHEMARETPDAPDVALVENVIVVYSYLDADGEQQWAAHTRGDARLSHCLGLLDMAKAWLLDMHRLHEDDNW